MMMQNIFGDDLFENFFDMKPFYAPKDRPVKAPLMRTDIKETDAGYEMEVELPGYDKEDVELELKEGYLTVRASKTVDAEETEPANETSADGANDCKAATDADPAADANGCKANAKAAPLKYLHRERYVGSCRRTFYIGKNVDKKEIHAKFENGVLTVGIPKAQPRLPKKEDLLISIEG